jgi:hypothetical protein
MCRPGVCIPPYVSFNGLVDERAEAALRHERRIEIPHRAGRRVPGIREERLTRFLPLPIHPLERGARKVHLAPHFDRFTRSAAQF